MMFMQCFCVCVSVFLCVFFSDFLYKRTCCGYSFELHQQVDGYSEHISL